MAKLASYVSPFTPFKNRRDVFGGVSQTAIDSAAAIWMVVGVGKFPDDVLVWRDFKEAGATAFADQGVAIGQALRAGDGPAEERIFGIGHVFPSNGFGDGVEFDDARISAQGAVVENEDIAICEHVGLVLPVDDARPPCPHDVARVVVDDADDVVAAVREEDVAGLEPRIAVGFPRLVGRDELERVVVRPVKGELPGGAVQDVLPRFGRQTGFQVFEMLLAFPFPHQVLVAGDFDHVGMTLEFRPQGRAHGFVEGVDEQVAVVAHLKVVVRATAHAPDQRAIRVVFKNADIVALGDARAVVRGHQEMPVGQQPAMRLHRVLREMPRMGGFAIHVDEVHHRFFADFPVGFRKGFRKQGVTAIGFVGIVLCDR